MAEFINKWRRKESLRNTYLKRPELLDKAELSEDDLIALEEIKNECK